MDSENRNQEILTCKNIMNTMIDAMGDILLVDDDMIDRVIDSRYRTSITMLEKARERIRERKEMKP